MYFLSTFLLMSLGATAILCKSIPSKPLYDQIVEMCPVVKSDSEYKNQVLFQVCNDWDKIKNIITETESKNDWLCGLYFESVTKYCKVASNVTIPNNRELSTYENITVVCDKMEMFQEPQNKLIYSKDKCDKYCADEFKQVEYLCKVYYYYRVKDLSVTKAKNHMLAVPADGNEQAKLNKLDRPQTVDQSGTKNITAVGVQQAIKGADEHGYSNATVRNLSRGTVQGGPRNSTMVEKTPAAREPQKHKESNDALRPAEPVNTVESPDVSAVESNSDTNLNKPTNEDNKKNVTHNVPKQSSVEEGQVNEVAEVTTQDDSNNIDNEAAELGDDKDEAESDEAASDVQDQPASEPKQNYQTQPVSFSTSDMEGDSYFFTYFTLLCVVSIIGYVCYHNKQKILALALEGRRGKRPNRGRRPNSANYHKLDSNLEEAITSACNKNTSNVIY